MKINPRILVKHELIGLLVKISKSTHEDFIGLSGIIVDETAKTIKILSEDKKIKTIPKQNCIFDIILPDGIIVRVNGKLLMERPEERIRKRFKYW